MDIFLDRNSNISIFRQLCEQLRQSIISGRLKSGARIPSSRVMQNEIGVSRGTIRNVYEQLLSEGYLETRKGKGTFVANSASFKPVPGRLVSPSSKTPHLSKRSVDLCKIFYHPNVRTIRAFMPGVPDVREFPFSKWHRISKTTIKPSSDALDYSDPLGYLPLRQAICEHVYLTRGVACDTRQVVICNGGEEALRLIGTLLLDPGDSAWVEEPCFVGRRLVLRSIGVQCVPVVVDELGFNVEQALKQNAKVKLAYVVPSRNYPLGTRMSLNRRLQLSDWAESNDTWIVEDDFDCEFRYHGHPVAPIYSMQKNNQVIYMSSFTTTLLPAFRLAFMIMPEPLLEPMSHLLSLGKPTPVLLQSVLAEFVRQGFYASHVRRMRKLYLKRQRLMRELIDHHNIESVFATDAGFNVLVELPERVDAQRFSHTLLSAHDIVAYSLSEYYMTNSISKRHQNTLVLGFACLNQTEIERSMAVFNNRLKTL